MKVFFIEQLLRTIRQTAYSAYREHILSMQVNSQGSRVSRAAHTLLRWRGGMWRCSAQALLLTAVSVAGALAEVLAAPAAVSGRTEAGSGDRVTQRPVLTLTAAAAVRTPVIPVTGCTNTQSWGSLHTPQYILHWGQPREAVLYCGFTMVTGDVSTFLMDLYRFKIITRYSLIAVILFLKSNLWQETLASNNALGKNC